MLPFWNFGILPPGPTVFEHFKMGYNLELLVKHSVGISVAVESLSANKRKYEGVINFSSAHRYFNNTHYDNNFS
jgi:hypothetical protein